MGCSGRESKVIALTPHQVGAQTQGVNGLRTSSNTHLLILRGMRSGMPFDMFYVHCFQGLADSILFSFHVK